MALVRRKGRKTWTWQAMISGKLISKSTKTTNKAEAVRVAARFQSEAELLRGRPETLRRFSGAATAEVAWLESEVSTAAATRASYCFKSFAMWLGKDIDLHRIDRDLLMRFQSDRFKAVSTSTLAREMHAMMRLLKRNGLIVERPRAPVKLKRTEQRGLTRNEIERFFAALDDEDHVTLFATMLATGARLAELLPSPKSEHTPLLKSELNESDGTITLRNAKTRPGERQRSRSVAIQPELMSRLCELAKRTDEKVKHVFTANGSVGKLFDRACQRAEIPKLDALGRKVTTHSLRHSYATEASTVVASVFELQRLLGHRRMISTEQYVHADAGAVIIDVSGHLMYGGDVRSDEKAKEPAETGS